MTLICFSHNFILFTEPPTPSPVNSVNGGGSGIELGYRQGGSTGVFTPLTAGQSVTLSSGATYEFQCTVLEINSVNPIPASGTPATGTCANSGTSSIAIDLVNIFFYFVNTTPQNGNSGSNEPSTYTNPLYSVTDTFTQQLDISNGCPSSLTCRAAFDTAGNPSASAAASPFITVSINYESKFRFVVVFFSIYCLHRCCLPVVVHEFGWSISYSPW